VVKELIMAPEAPSGFGPYSPTLAVGEWIFLAGQGGFDPESGTLVSGGTAEQTVQTIRNIEALLRAAGASLDDVASCLVHLADLADYGAFNVAYAEQFRSEIKPVRTMVRADLVADMHVEVTAIAHRAR
jgi:2-iminobutanoate/2-iminopropanoate deaminase